MVSFCDGAPHPAHLSHRAVRFAEAWVQPLLGEAQPVRRTNTVFPETRAQGEARRRATALGADEVVTTARNSQLRRTPAPRSNGATTAASNTTSRPDNDSTQDAGQAGGTMRQLMNELGIGGGPRPAAGGAGTVRAPSESEIGILTSMFPDLEREVILGVLQRRCVPVSHPAHCLLRLPPSALHRASFPILLGGRRSCLLRVVIDLEDFGRHRFRCISPLALMVWEPTR